VSAPPHSAPVTLDAAIDAIAAGAEDLDRSPRFPDWAFTQLRAAGVLALTVPGEDRTPVSVAREWATLRAVAAADGSVGRILDGHLNAVERIAVAAPDPLRSEVLDKVAAGELLLGVWGADPGPGEGDPARLVEDARVEGVKTFCSGAGGLDAALVLVRAGEGQPPSLAYVDLSQGVLVDTDWYRAAGMRASESHRVLFSGARVPAVLGEPGEIGRDPWFGRDAMRTAACWAGLVDAVRQEALAALTPRAGDDLAGLAAGRIEAAGATVDVWLDAAAARIDADPAASPRDLSVQLRVAVAAAGRATVAAAVEALGARPLATGTRLDRARRDLELFLNQHRLDPLVAGMGRRALER
jgi:alkylation response protein AidB-like acyl-CoA dehydrogenase